MQGGSSVHLTARSLYLALCRHLFIISDFLFSIVLGSPLRISNFSDRQRSHFLVPHLYGNACLWRVHLISYGIFLSLRSQIYLARLVQFFFSAFLKEDKWLANLLFHFGSVKPVYFFVSVSVITSPRYTIAFAKQFPFSGHLASVGQLHFRASSVAVGWERSFLLCLVMMDFMFGVQL